MDGLVERQMDRGMDGWSNGEIAGEIHPVFFQILAKNVDYTL